MQSLTPSFEVLIKSLGLQILIETLIKTAAKVQRGIYFTNNPIVPNTIIDKINNNLGFFKCLIRFLPFNDIVS